MTAPRKSQSRIVRNPFSVSGPDEEEKAAQKERSIKFWMEVSGLAAVVVTCITGASVVLVQCQANAINQKAVDVSQKALEDAHKSIDLTQQSITLNQKSVDLTRQSLGAAQQALKLSQAGNDISEKSLELANTAWVNIVVNKVRVDDAHTLKIEFTYTNHSGVLAAGIETLFHVSDESWPGDINAIRVLSSDSDPLMPNQVISSEELVATDRKASEVESDIRHGRRLIEAYVRYITPLGKEHTFKQTFAENGYGVFDYAGTEYGINFDDIIDKELGVKKTSK